MKAVMARLLAQQDPSKDDNLIGEYIATESLLQFKQIVDPAHHPFFLHAARRQATLRAQYLTGS